MARTLPLLLLASLVFPVLASAKTYELVWQDEFEGDSLDTSRWDVQLGTGCPDLCGWGNNELQFYRAENATVADGLLTITAKEEFYGGRAYTSARIRSIYRGDFRYGRFEARIKLPAGRGLWPAFWMLPTHSVYGTWAASGEIDIMELVGQVPYRTLGTIHYGGSWPENTYSTWTYTKTSPDFTEDFHVFALEWDETELRWYVDDVLYRTESFWWSSQSPYPAPFDQDFHLLLNLAVGGNLPGAPDATTPFPAEMVIDYVRVYEQADPCDLGFDSLDHAAPQDNGWYSFNGQVGGGGIGPNTTDLPPDVGGQASLEAGYGSGGTPGFLGGFGRGRPMGLGDATHFEFWINPDFDMNAVLEINLQDDDNGDNLVPGSPDGADDEFQAEVSVAPTGADVVAGGGWQHVVMPLSSFTDDNSYHYGGNGIFDPIGVKDGGNGMLNNVVVTLLSQDGSSAIFRTDEWSFTRRTAGISGRVVQDLDADGFLDGGEPGIEDVQLILEDADTGRELARTLTDASGAYDFQQLLAGPRRVRVDPATLPAGLDPTVDPDGIMTEFSYVRGVDCDEILLDQDFGFSADVVTSGPAPRRADVLHPAVPNPFNPQTVISFDLAASGPAKLVLYDAVGRRVRTLVGGTLTEGTHRYVWDGVDDRGRSVASGVYLARLTTDRGEQVQRLVLVR